MEAVKIVRYHGISDPLTFIDGEEYKVLGVDVETGWYRVVDETQEDYLYPPSIFEVVN